MNVSDFKKVLEQHENKELLFEYAQDEIVGANYHLTEVKNVQFNTTDCGGKTNFWEETHFQLWENPSELGKRTYMTTDKILAILNRVDRINPLMKSTAVKIEYGNEVFNTSVMPVAGVEIGEKTIIVKLFEEAARCKAIDACGIKEGEGISQKEAVSCCV